MKLPFYSGYLGKLPNNMSALPKVYEQSGIGMNVKENILRLFFFNFLMIE